MARYRNINRTPTQNSRKKRIIIAATIAIVVLLGILTALELTGKTHFILNRHKDTYTTPRTANSETKGEAPSHTETPTQENKNQDGTWSSDNKTPEGTTPESNAKLTEPTGNFVSNHRPNLSGSPAPNSIQSSCVTTPGATCQIVFTKGSETKSLPAQKTDIGGGTYWTWKLQDIGLGEGSWKVQAKATLGSQTSTAEDALTLEVSK